MHRCVLHPVKEVLGGHFKDVLWVDSSSNYDLDFVLICRAPQQGREEWYLLPLHCVVHRTQHTCRRLRKWQESDEPAIKITPKLYLKQGAVYICISLTIVMTTGPYI
jgi:hypothetical protein